MGRGMTELAICLACALYSMEANANFTRHKSIGSQSKNIQGLAYLSIHFGIYQDCHTLLFFLFSYCKSFANNLIYTIKQE